MNNNKKASTKYFTTRPRDQLPDQPLPYDRVDTDAEALRSPRLRWKWASNLAEAEDAMNQRILQLFEPLRGKSPEYIEKYCWRFSPAYDPLSSQAKNSTPRRTCPLPVISYFSQKCNTSCHEIVFGTKKPVELFGKTKHFVRLFFQAPEKEQYAIISYLQDHQEIVDNPFYTYKQRVPEAVFYNGGLPKAVKEFPNFQTLYKNRVYYIFENPIPPVMEQNFPSEVNRFSGWYFVLLHYCTEYKLAADYFLLHDYSQYAILDDKPLTDAEAGVLRTYLMATPEAQEAVRNQITLLLVDNPEMV